MMILLNVQLPIMREKLLSCVWCSHLCQTSRWMVMHQVQVKCWANFMATGKLEGAFFCSFQILLRKEMYMLAKTRISGGQISAPLQFWLVTKWNEWKLNNILVIKRKFNGYHVSNTNPMSNIRETEWIVVSYKVIRSHYYRMRQGRRDGHQLPLALQQWKRKKNLEID